MQTFTPPHSTTPHPTPNLSLSDLRYTLSLVRLYLPAQFDHEDIAVAILIESWLNGHPRPAKLFVRQRCINTAAQYRRELEAMEDHALHYTTETSSVTHLSDKHTVNKLTAVLTAQEKKIIALRYFMDLTVEQCAAELGLTAGTVSSVTAEALHKMREASL